MRHSSNQHYLLMIILLCLITACNSHMPALSNSITGLGWEGDTILWASGDIRSDGLLRMIRYNVADRSATVYERYFDRFLATRDGIVWTIDGSVSRFDGQTWQDYTTSDGLTGGSYRSLLEARDGSIWLGGAGLNHFDTQTNRWSIVIPRLQDKCDSAACWEYEPGAVYSLLQTRDGSIWAGTTQGVIRYDGVSTETWGLSNTSVKVLLEARDGTVWAGTDNGISHNVGKAWQSWSYPGERPLTPGYQVIIERMLETKDGTIWAATSDRLMYWDGVSWHDNNTPCNYEITSLLETADGSVWVSSQGYGVCRWDMNKWHTFGTGQGLNDNNVNAMLESSDGMLWAGTLRGIYRYDPNTDRWQTFPNVSR